MISIDEAFIDLSGSLHLFGALADAAEAIKDKVKSEMRLPASVGIAPDRMVAKIASGQSKPAGITVITQDKVLDFLWPLSVDNIPGVGSKTNKILRRLGIKTIGDLANTDLYFLHDNLGNFAYSLWAVANGRAVSPGGNKLLDKSISSEYTFAKDVADIELIRAKLMQLSRKISFRLREKKIKAHKLCLKVRYSDFKTQTRVFSFSRATNHYDIIYRQAVNGYRRWVKPGAKIRLIGIKAYKFIPGDYKDFIFKDAKQERQEKIHNALKNIDDKYGFGKVFLGIEKFKTKSGDCDDTA